MITNTMTHKGYSAQIMEARRLEGEQIHPLPQGSPLFVYPSDAFKKYPETWMKGPGVFVVPVRPDKGLWFNFRMNSEANTAVIMTVKGCNPITGLPTSGFHLERYDERCPKHGCNFQADRFCPDCGYKWPDRGYLSGLPCWWDGFRSDDGSVRQFYFTEDELKDIATHMIGKDSVVPAFGFAFYSPKERRPEIQISTRGAYYSNGLNIMSGSQAMLGNITPTGSSINYVYTANASTGQMMNGDVKIFATNSVGMGTPTPDAPLAVSAVPCGASAEAHDDFFGAMDTLSESTKMCASRSMKMSKSKSASPKFMQRLRKGDPIMAGSLISEDFHVEHEEKTSGGIIMLKSEQYDCADINVISAEDAERKHQGLRIAQERFTPTKKVEVSVGAGARIAQKLPTDMYGLDTWKDTPDATMTIYFVFQEQFEEMAKDGLRSFESVADGFLSGCPVG